MKNRNKVLIMGLSLSLAFATGVVASNNLTDIKVKLNEVKLLVNGNEIVATNILYDGTTYVPVRDVANAFDKEVDFDSKTQTVNIKDKSKAEDITKPEKSITLKTALESFENLYPNSKVSEIKYNYDNKHYEIEGMNSNSEYDLNISNDGSIINKHSEKDRNSKIKINRETFSSKDLSTIMNSKDIESIGLDKFKSLRKSTGNIKSLKLEKDNGKLVYELEISSGKDDIEIKINAQDGSIIEIDD